MPVYEYECQDCDKVFEVQQKISDGPMSDCPECGGGVKKIVSMSSFQLKGQGWYADGYSGPSNGKSAAASKKDSAAPACKKGGACAGCPASAS